jgi:hypothetical protein
MDSYLLGFIGLIVAIAICVFILWVRSLPPAKSQEYVRKRFFRYVVFKPLGGLTVDPNSVFTSSSTYLGSVVAERDTFDEAKTIKNAYPNPKELNIIMRLGSDSNLIRDKEGKPYEVIKKEEEEKLKKSSETFIIGKNVRVIE